MADNSPIEWLRGGDDRQGATWNIITGCSVKSAGCKNCYAMRLAGTRMRQHPSRVGLTQQTAAGPVWNGLVRFNAEWLDQPLRWRRPRMIFVCAHGDLFHEAVPDEWIDRVFTVMALAQQHIFIVLTKRAQRMCNYMITARRRIDAPMVWPLPNVWLGVSVEHQSAAEERVPYLLETPAAVRWVSAEPLLGLVDLTHIVIRRDGDPITELSSGLGDYVNSLAGNFMDSPRIGWVVGGGESGNGARPMHPFWPRKLRNDCAEAGVPFFFKQWGEWHPASSGHGGQRGAFHGDTFMPGWGDISEAGEDNNMVRAGKHAFGYRLLDGVEHDAFPGAQLIRLQT